MLRTSLTYSLVEGATKTAAPSQNNVYKVIFYC